MSIAEPSPNYQVLAEILNEAYEQAATGKGAERHGQDLPFEVQPMQQISMLLGTDKGMAYQAIKKIQEAGRMERAAAERELLGAINYIAGMIVFYRNCQKDEELSVTVDYDAMRACLAEELGVKGPFTLVDLSDQASNAFGVSPEQGATLHFDGPCDPELEGDQEALLTLYFTEMYKKTVDPWLNNDPTQGIDAKIYRE